MYLKNTKLMADISYDNPWTSEFQNNVAKTMDNKIKILPKESLKITICINRM